MIAGDTATNSNNLANWSQCPWTGDLVSPCSLDNYRPGVEPPAVVEIKHMVINDDLEQSRGSSQSSKQRW